MLKITIFYLNFTIFTQDCKDDFRQREKNWERNFFEISKPVFGVYGRSKVNMPVFAREKADGQSAGSSS